LVAKRFYEAHGGKVINITPGSKLNVFERQDWHDW